MADLVGDRHLFVAARAPQLPYERCRMLTTGMPSVRRRLRASQQDRQLYEKASTAKKLNFARRTSW